MCLFVCQSVKFKVLELLTQLKNNHTGPIRTIQDQYELYVTNQDYKGPIQTLHEQSGQYGMNRYHTGLFRTIK